MTITRFGQGETVTRPHADQRQSADPPTNRGNDTRAAKQTKFAASWKRRLLDFFTITSEFRPPKAIEKGFLGRLWRRGAHYNNVATLRALIDDTSSDKQLDLGALNKLTKDQAHRLRKNLLNHGEIPFAIEAVRRSVKQCPGCTQEFMIIVDMLRRNLDNTFETLSEKSGETATVVRIDERKQERLERMLWAAAARKPIEALSSKGPLKRQGVEDLCTLCLLKSESEVQDSLVHAFADKCMNAPRDACQEVLGFLVKAMEEGVGKGDAGTHFDLAWEALIRVNEEPVTVEVPMVPPDVDWILRQHSVTGSIWREDAANLIAAALGGGSPPKEMINRYLTFFEGASKETRDRVLCLIADVLKGGVNARFALLELKRLFEDVSSPETVQSPDRS
jgi:hypothetical protein